jgi:hypothetical protein
MHTGNNRGQSFIMCLSLNGSLFNVTVEITEVNRSLCALRVSVRVSECAYGLVAREDGLNSMPSHLSRNPTPTQPQPQATNLYNNPAFAQIVALMKARLLVLGAAAPPWAIVPEVQNMSANAFAGALCDAAKRFGATAPIDV